LVALGAIAVGVIFLSWDPEVDTPEGASAESHSTADEQRSGNLQAASDEAHEMTEPDMALWQAADPDSVAYETASVRRNAVTERYAMRYEADALRALDVGAVVSIDMPTGTSPGDARIEQRVEHANGDVSLVANIDDGAGFLVMTLGESDVHVTLSSPTGAYELSGDTTSGWLVPASQIGPIGPEGYNDAVVVEPKPRALPAPRAPQGGNP
jgi:hypothetical protein